MKRVLCLVLSLAMALSLMACGGAPSSTPPVSTPASGSASQPAAPGGIDFSEAPYTLKVCYPVMSEAQADLALIQEKVNEIALREINAQVEFEAVGLFSMANIYALKASSQEKMDLIMLMPGYSYLTKFANSNMIQPIDEVLEQWGPDIKASMGELLPAGQFHGKQYAIPQNKDVKKNGYGFNVSVPLCEKYNIDIAAIKTIEDLEAAFAIIKANEPGVTIVAPESTGGSVAMPIQGEYDSLNVQGLTLVEENGKLTVACNLEQQSYLDSVARARDWYQKGYVSKDVLTAQEAGSRMLDSGKAFCSAVTSIASSMGGDNGVEYKAIMFENGYPLECTNDSQLLMWAVPTSCERPDKAIQFINLLDSSEELSNLMMYGIEGSHYKVEENGTVTSNVDASWTNYWYIFGDFNKMKLRSSAPASAGVTPEEYKKLLEDWNTNITKQSPAYGFIFDETNVKTEVASCTAVHNEFGSAIGNGTVDPATEVPKYKQKLYDAGLQKIIDEVQTQLDAWVAQKG